MHRNLLILVLAATLAACGGGGSSTIGGGGGGGGGSGWQPGVFLDWSTFEARCESPRSGIDPWTNLPFADVQGTTLDENNFLRSYSNDTYLWYDEIVDRDPWLYNDPITYFELLKTDGLSPSGQPKDKYHYTYDSAEYYQLSQSGVSAGYGIQWAFLSTVPPRELLIAYTEPDTPATNIPQPLARGARILAIDGVDIDDNTQAGVDILNAGLRPADVGESHTFTVLDLGSAVPRDVTLTSAEITTAPVRTTTVISTPTGEVGYMLFNDHIATAEQALIDAVNQLNAHDGGNGIDDLVLDLRYNGGGYLGIASELAYMIAGPVATAGRIFEKVTFNDKHPVTSPVTGEPLGDGVPFIDTAIGPPFFNGTPGEPLPSLDLPRVYVLTSNETCSASEAVMNGLRGIGIDVYQIGSTTCGKPYGFYPTDNCGTTYFTIQFKGVNDIGFGDYSDGFSPANSTGPGEDVPGCSIGDDFTRALGDPDEERLATALAYRDGAACPAASGFASGAMGIGTPVPDEEKIYIPKPIWLKTRIMLP